MTDRSIQHSHTGVFFKSFDARAKCNGAIVMDSGCGDGYASRAFITYGAALVLAYDPVDYKDEKYTHPRIKWRNSLELIPNDCDIIWSHHVIEHTENPIDYLWNLREYLFDHVELWLTCPNTANNSVFAKGHLSNFTIANLVLCLQKADYCVENIRWMVCKGQIRVRIPKTGMIPNILPKPFNDLLAKNEHFNVNDLPTKWRWNEE